VIDLPIIVKAFILISLAEFADKTQIAAMLLASKFDWRQVFIGGFIGFMTVNLLCLIAGVCVGSVISIFWAKIMSSLLLILFGLLSIRSEQGLSINLTSSKSALVTSASIIASMELADKTNLAVVALSIKTPNATSILIGVSLSALLMMFTSSVIGSRISGFMKFKAIKVASSIVFIALGVYILLEAFNLLP